MTTLQAFSLPETPEEIADWLDEVLLSESLGDVVAQLQAVHQPVGAVMLQELELPETVYTQGCAVLSTSQIERLLCHPALLLDLQEEILIRDAAFWQSQMQPLPQAQLDAGWERLNASLSPAPAEAVTTSTQPPRRFFSHLLTAASAAAVVLIGVFFWQSAQPDNPAAVVSGWGWNAPDALEEAPDAKAYLVKLADGGQAWFNKPTDTEQEFVTRLLQYRKGCSRLIRAEHPNLDADQKIWLIGKCQTWAKKLDQHLVDLENGTDFATVRQQTGETVNALVKALRAEAEKLARS